MASNKEWRTEIEALSVELGVAIPDNFLQLGNPKLEALGLELRAKKAAAVGGSSPPAGSAATPAGDGAQPPSSDQVSAGVGVEPAGPPPSTSDGQVTAPVPAPAPRPPGGTKRTMTMTPAPARSRYFVAQGKTLPTKHRGLLGALQQVKAHEVARGEAELEELVAKGTLTRQS